MKMLAIMRKTLFIAITVFAAVLLFSCQKIEQLFEKPGNPIKVLYAGSQGDNGFQMWIIFYEDESRPVRVLSGMCRNVDDEWIDTDEEFLKCNYTNEGFTLCDQETGQVLYTATNIQKYYHESGYYISVSWSHSPGPAWDANAIDKGWQREIELCIQTLGEG